MNKKILCFPLVPALLLFAVFTADLVITEASYSTLSNGMLFERLEGNSPNLKIFIIFADRSTIVLTLIS